MTDNIFHNPENTMKRLCMCIVISLVSLLSVEARGEESIITPIRRVIDLAVGETASVTLDDGSRAEVTLISIDESRDSFRNAVRNPTVTVEVNGEKKTIVPALYTLPQSIGGVQIDCTVTRAYYSSPRSDPWGLSDGADARFRLWPAGSPWIRPGTFVYPARQKWFASSTQMANEPVYVDGGEVPGQNNVYYHYGLDIGGAEGMMDILSATDGVIVSKAGKVLDGHDPATTPVSPRYDVIYIQDDRGWYYRYSHLKSFETNVILGERVTAGQKIGELGKEGGSGGWSHFHFDINALQPSGKWGIEEGYAYYWQTYTETHTPELIAVARPHKIAAIGEEITLDGSKSVSFDGRITAFDWRFSDGSSANGATQTRTYDKPGVYSEILTVKDDNGNSAVDFTVVNVIDPSNPETIPPTIHAAYAPTTGIRAGDPVTFKVRVFRSENGGETWDFGDGSTAVKTVSHPGDQHLPDGYAETVHRFSAPGYYIITVTHTGESGLSAVDHLCVSVEE